MKKHTNETRDIERERIMKEQNEEKREMERVLFSAYVVIGSIVGGAGLVLYVIIFN